MWVLLSAMMFMALASAYLRLRAGRSRWPRTALDGVDVMISDGAGPAVIGVLHPTIVLPAWAIALPVEERQLIVTHEREHAAARDTILLTLGALLVAVMPWNALLWWQQRRLMLAVETDCDSRVLARAPGLRAYADALLRTATLGASGPWLAAGWGNSTSNLERRLREMTRPRSSGRAWRSIPVAAVSFLVACAGYEVAAVKPAVMAGPAQFEIIHRPNPIQPVHIRITTSDHKAAWIRVAITGGAPNTVLANGLEEDSVHGLRALTPIEITVDEMTPYSALITPVDSAQITTTEATKVERIGEDSEAHVRLSATGTGAVIVSNIGSGHTHIGLPHER
jgi:hypothetical protein